MKTFVRFYGWSTAFSLVALGVSFWMGYQSGGTLGAGLSLLFTALMLGILETSLSFDNAVVNAKILETMPPFWRKMFLTIGILIAVFGMRIVFPLVIVWLVSSLPFDAVLAMTWQDPQAFQKIVIDQNVVISGFGGAFLWMVFNRFFFDPHKDIHWVPGLERNMSRLGRMEAVWVVTTLIITLITYALMPALHRPEFLLAAVLGIVVFLLVDGLGTLLKTSHLAASGGLGAFLYLEVLDASFSFDGVIGAFAITDNLYIIALGLGIGAFFVRSMTIQLVEMKTLGAFRYLEHGAFWAIGALSAIMYLHALEVHVPEVVAGGAGLVIIIISFIASVFYNKRNAPLTKADSETGAG